MDMYDRIDALLKSKGMSRRQLAQKSNVPQSTLQNAISRKSKSFPYACIPQIAKALGVDIGVLFSDEAMQELDRKVRVERWAKAIHANARNRGLWKSDIEFEKIVQLSKSNPKAVEQILIDAGAGFVEQDDSPIKSVFVDVEMTMWILKHYMPIDRGFYP